MDIYRVYRGLHRFMYVSCDIPLLAAFFGYVALHFQL